MHNYQYIRNINRIFIPEQFQGEGKRSSYFEGWYFKVINEAESCAIAVIPGIAIDKTGSKHAFIQILDGKNKRSAYHRFDFDLFSWSDGEFKIAIGENVFSTSYFELHLPGLEGRLDFSGTVPWPCKWYSPGIMGPYSFVPFMECYHGIVSLDHAISGELTIDNERINFDGGRGYTEKDWGRSFPQAYVWMQSNHFSQGGISVKASVARIPWLGGSFTGFIAGIWLGDRLIRFTTYNGSFLNRLGVGIDRVSLELENRTYRLQIRADRHDVTALAAPILGSMEGRIGESMTSSMEVLLSEKSSGKMLLADTGRNSGVEVAGNLSMIVKTGIA